MPNMWPTAIIALVVAVPICAFGVGAVSVVLYERRRHQRLMRASAGISRGLSTYHRAHLSVDGNNYAQIPEPQTSLRRSVYLPYGVVSEGWVTIPSQESLATRQMSAIPEQPEEESAAPHQKRRRSLRNSFSHSLRVPKTRHQKKIERAMPLNPVARSPLSVITEISDPTTSIISPAIGIAELPTETTPKTTPPRDDNVSLPARPDSIQWPLPVLKRMSKDTTPVIQTNSAARNTKLMRMHSTGRNIDPLLMSVGQRSISVASTLSTAPEDPLPPLPLFAPPRHSHRRDSKMRFSTASTDTVGSSVLGAGATSPSQSGTDFTSVSLASPCIDLNPSGLQDLEPGSDGWEGAAVTIGSPPGKQTKQGYRNRTSAVGSLRASIGSNSLLRSTSTSHGPDRTNGNSLLPRAGRSNLSSLDASNWMQAPSSTGGSFRNSLTASLLPPIARNGMTSERHSMFEQHTGIDKLAPDSAVPQDIAKPSLNRQSSQRRPASVASSNPFHWDQRSRLPETSTARRNPPGSLRRGHKRQNCVRISNLPAIDISRRNSKLPQMVEEEEEQQHPETPPRKKGKIPGLILLEQGEEALIDISRQQAQKSPSPSPFHNRPILEPTPRLKKPAYSSASSTDSSDSPRRDSDIFSNSRYDPSAPNAFARGIPDRQWPLSPTPQNHVKLNQTPLALRFIEEPYDPESPVLPSPNLRSATLFVGASRVQEPRNLPASRRSSRTSSPSPLISRTTKKGSSDDLRRSVMLLRRMNSETRDKRDRISKLYRNIGHDHDLGSTPSVASVASLKSPRVDQLDAGLPVTNRSTVGSNLLSAERGSTNAFPLAFTTIPRSKSKIYFAPSPSMISNGDVSIWEDASVRGDSPEPDLPPPSAKSRNLTLKATTTDKEALENFGRQDCKRDNGRTSGGNFHSPPGKGLGLMGLGSKVWGTPASLYDRDGFLKD